MCTSVYVHVGLCVWVCDCTCTCVCLKDCFFSFNTKNYKVSKQVGCGLNTVLNGRPAVHGEVEWTGSLKIT